MQTIPTHAIKGLVEIQLQDNSWCILTVVAVQQISSISKVVSDATAKNEPRLVRANERWNQRLQPFGEYFRDPFDRAVLQCNRSEVFWRSSGFFLGRSTK